MALATEFRVLGPVEVVVDGVAQRIGSATQRTLLALLLAHPNEAVSTDRIVDVLWPDTDSDARRKLWFHVSKLRSTLQIGEAGDAAGQILVTSQTGYMLRVHADQLDSVRFETLARRARDVAEDDPERTSKALREALALWRGEPFEDVLHENAVPQEVARLNELRLAALADRLEADLALGRDSELVPELEALVSAHPYRERFRAQLMLALYRAGRQADALEAYRRARRTLVEELGIEPTEELKELERRILAHDPALVESDAPSQPAAEAPVPREERKVVTVLFADLVDFTATAEQLDPEDVRAFLTPYYAHIRSELERYGASVEKFIGDAVMALFGAEEAHEDDAERAVRAALAIRDWLAERGGPQQARIAIATGDAHVALGARSAEGEPVAVGDVVNTAARLQAAAPVNGVLVGDQTFRATRHAIDYREVEPVAAKGRREPIDAWEAIRALAPPGVDPSRHGSPFVGRERELAALQERLAWATSERSPQLVTILGVPGIGKSRLVSELRGKAVDDKPLNWRQGRSLPYGDGVSFWALGEIVKAEAGMLETDSAEEVERKLVDAVEQVVGDPAVIRRVATSLRILVGAGGGEVVAGPRTETFAAWRHFFEALADESPLVLVFEDLHWADESLLDFVDELTDRVSGVPLLVVATARPELLSRRPGWAGGKPNAVTISLPPLSEAEIKNLLDGLLKETGADTGTEDVLVARIGGNPLYAEQFCRMVVETGGIDELPETVHAIIAARLDSLSPQQKQLLEDAAVVGKVFWAGALEAIGGIPREEADELLHPLERSEFVHRMRRSSVAGDSEYAFRHDLLRDVAYGVIPRTARGERHRLTAEWIESLGHLEDHAELLAHHFLAALECAPPADEDLGGLLARTWQALLRAGLRAIRLSANDRAVEYLSRAIEVLGQLPEGDERNRAEGELQLQLGVALFALRGFAAPEVERAYARATELMTTSAPAAQQFPVHFGLAIHHSTRGDFERASRVIETMGGLASDDESLRLEVLHCRWMSSFFGGQVEDALAAADEGHTIYRREDHHRLTFRYGNHDPGVCALSIGGLARALHGDSRQGIDQIQTAIRLSDELGHAISRLQPLTYLAWSHQINGDFEATLAVAERALALESEVAFPVWFRPAHAMRGWALTRLGRDEEGRAELESSLAGDLSIGSYITAVLFGTLLAEAHLRSGRLDSTRTVIGEMRPLADSMKTYVFEPELLRVEAEWLRAVGREADARRLLLRAIESAGERGSWALAVRSSVALFAAAGDRGSDLELLGQLCTHLPDENDTDYGRAAEAILGGPIPTPTVR